MRVWIKEPGTRNLVLFGHMPESVVDLRYMWHTGTVNVHLREPTTTGPLDVNAQPADMVAHTCTLIPCDKHDNDRHMDVIVVAGGKQLAQWHRCATYPEGRKLVNA